MRPGAVGTFAAVLMLASVSVLAQDAARQPSPGKANDATLKTPAWFEPAQRKDPWTLRLAAPEPYRAPAASPASAKVVCGMTVIPADPTFDARMRHAVPDGGTRFAIRSIEPRICQTPPERRKPDEPRK
jgi:hypothetical protein